MVPPTAKEPETVGPKAQVAATQEPVDLAEVSDGEIMNDGDEDKDIVMMNRM